MEVLVVLIGILMVPVIIKYAISIGELVFKGMGIVFGGLLFLLGLLTVLSTAAQMLSR